jgi:hypothetical protein
MSLSFLFSAFVPFEQHILSSIDRLLAEVIVLPLLWLVFIAFAGRERDYLAVPTGSPASSSP